MARKKIKVARLPIVMDGFMEVAIYQQKKNLIIKRKKLKF